jgi:predicted ATPase
MIISKIALVNWKNFKNAEINLEERNFVVGANASGKSNFLDVIRFVRDIVKQAGGLQYAVSQRGGVSKIRCLAGRQVRGVTITFQLSSSDSSHIPLWEYSLSFKHSGGGIVEKQASIFEEKVTNLEEDKIILHREEGNEDEDAESLKYTYLEQATVNKEFRDISFFFRDIQYLHIVPQLIRDADSYVLSSTKEDFYGRNLLDMMNRTNLKTRNSYLKRINEVLQIAVPQLKQLDFITDKKGIPHLEAIYEHWRAKGAKQQESQFSDGTLRLIGFMWALLDGQETILLEEPELYLHAAIVKQLPGFIYKMQKRKGRVRQVIISTHSYEILSDSGISGHETIVLFPSKEGTGIIKADDIEEIKKYLDAGFSVAEAVIPAVSPEKIERLQNL